ncbi:MAG: hypothetical protein WAU70_02145 [Flavobacteriales bacterium]
MTYSNIDDYVDAGRIDSNVAAADMNAVLDEAMGDSDMNPQDEATANALMNSVQDGTNRMLGSLRPMAMTKAICWLLGLVGVFLMWQLKKMGFWVYLLTTAIGTLCPLYFIGANVLGIGYVGIVGVVSLLFIILYAVNLKYMN